MSDILSKHDRESEKEYKIRLCKNKEQYNLTWSDISSLILKNTDLVINHDTVRKFWRYYQEGYEDAITNKTPSDELADLESKRLEIRKERMRLQDQKREMNKAVRNSARFEYIKEIIEAGLQNIASKKLIEFNPIEDAGIPEREGLVLFSDWHVGIFINNYWNEFNKGVLVRRVEKFINESVEALVSNDVKNVHIFNLGDYINGLIHVTSRIMATEDAVTQTLIVSELLSEVISIYANNFENVYLYFINGNHDRTISDKNDTLPSDSFGRFIPFYLKSRLAKFSNVSFVENKYDQDIISTEILGYKCYAVHGDKDSVKDVVSNLTLMTGEKPDYIFMGHIHHHYEDEIHGVEVVVNSCLSGTDTYAKEVRKTSKPAQKVIIFDKEVGRYATYNIRLDKC